jgi:hypothetical protein
MADRRFQANVMLANARRGLGKDWDNAENDLISMRREAACHAHFAGLV